MKDDWVSVFYGDVWHVKVLQTELDGLGIETFVPEYVPLDPSIARTPVPGISVFVRSADVERARDIIAQRPSA